MSLASIYRKVPTIDMAHHALTANMHAIVDIADYLTAWGIEDCAEIVLLHRHFPLYDDEVVTVKIESGRMLSTIVDGRDGTIPLSWYQTDAAEWVPYEFALTDATSAGVLDKCADLQSALLSGPKSDHDLFSGGERRVFGLSASKTGVFDFAAAGSVPIEISDPSRRVSETVLRRRSEFVGEVVMETAWQPDGTDGVRTTLSCSRYCTDCRRPRP